MERISKKISYCLSENKVIDRKDCKIYQHGIELFLTCVIEIGLILIAALLCRNFWNTTMFFFGFLPIRVYSGGYHADTRIRCFAVLVIVYIIFSSMIQYLDWRNYTYRHLMSETIINSSILNLSSLD